jgi:hypothetical protein
LPAEAVEVQTKGTGLSRTHPMGRKQTPPT